MEQHRHVHDEERQFQCATCNKLFKFASNLYAHMKLHEDRVLFKCLLCEETVKERRTMKKHIKKVHATSEEHLAELWEQFEEAK